jgi:hypothetical protein
MNHTSTSTDKIAASLEAIRGFGQHYDYDTTYIEELADASPGAFQAFEGGMSMGRFQGAAPADLLIVAKLTAVRAEDCGPCTELGVKMAREAGVPEAVIRGALNGGKGLSPEQLDIHRYARAVAANEEMDPGLLPRLETRWGREVVAELAIAIVATRLYPTLRRALGHSKSCSLIPSLVS